MRLAKTVVVLVGAALLVVACSKGEEQPAVLASKKTEEQATAPVKPLELPLLNALDAVEKGLAEKPQVRRVIFLATLLERLTFIMYDSKPDMDRIPETREARAQFLLLLEMGSEPGHLSHFVFGVYRWYICMSPRHCSFSGSSGMGPITRPTTLPPV